MMDNINLVPPVHKPEEIKSHYYVSLRRSHNYNKILTVKCDESVAEKAALLRGLVGAPLFVSPKIFLGYQNLA
jgi:hypothetical protein